MSSWTPIETADADALAYLETALELLPSDPAQSSVGDLGRLAAVSEGLARHLLGLRAGMAALARRAVEPAADSENPALAEIVDQRLRLGAQYRRAVRADERLDTYTAAALHAHGFNLDQLIAGE